MKTVQDVSFPPSAINHALGKPYTTSPTPAGGYPDLTFVYISEADSDWVSRKGKLNNGERVRAPHNSGGYVGWDGFVTGTDVVVRFDLERVEAIDTVRIWGFVDHSLSIDMPASLLIEHSDDDTNWSTAFSVSSLTLEPSAHDDGPWTANIKIDRTSNRYWRITFGDNGFFIFLSEIELWGPR